MLPPPPTTRLPLTTIEREREESAAAACDDERERVFFAPIAGDNDKRETREVSNILLSHSVYFCMK